MKNKKNYLVCLLLLIVVATQGVFSFEAKQKIIDSYDVIERKLVKSEYDSISEYYAYPVTVRLSNLKKVTFASILPIYTEERGWVRSQFLEKGDRVLYLKNGEVSYKSIWNVSIKDKMNVFYTAVNVHKTHTYFKDGVLVHNNGSSDSRSSSNSSSKKNNSGSSKSNYSPEIQKQLDAIRNSKELTDYEKKRREGALIAFAGKNEGSSSKNKNSGSSNNSAEPSAAELAAKAAQTALKATGSLPTDIEQEKSMVKKNQRASQEKLEEKTAKLEAAQVGDPVLVTTGAFVHHEVDIAYTGGISALQVARYYESTNTNLYSMGQSWASLLDSRIIRGVSTYEKTYLASLSSTMQELKRIQNTLVAHKNYPDIVYANSVIQGRYNEVNAIYQNLLLEEKLTNKIMELNKFVVNSKNENTYHTIGNGLLTYIDEKGSPIVFTFFGNGLWLPINSNKAQYMKIESQDKKNNVTEEGFILFEKNGKKTWFDKWGLIEKIVDKNDNELVFKRNNSTKVLESIQTPEGRTIIFKYNERGLVKSMHAPDGTFVQYGYTGNNLTSVIDVDGDKSTYAYDSRGKLTRFTKPDGSYVSFSYGLQNAQGEYLTTSTTNEEGFSEYFEYDLENNITVYTDHSGFKEYVQYDDYHRTIKIVDKVGKSTSYTYDNIGNISSMSINGNKTHYTYDSRGNKTQEKYSDGSKKEWKYNNFDQVTHYTDRDGVSRSVVYDVKGNPLEFKLGNITLERAQYDEKGNIIRTTDSEGNATDYAYDSTYNVSSKTSGSVSEHFEYDKNGNITKYIDKENRTYTFDYGPKKIVQTSPTGLQKTYITNNRKDVTSIKELDTQTGEERLYEYKYDKRHLLQAVIQGEKTLVSYDYYPAGQLKTETYGEKGKEDYWVTEYEYHSGSRYSVHRKKFTKDGVQEGQTYSETFTSEKGGREISHEIPLKGEEVFTFDAWNRLTAIENFIGETTKRELSPEGRVLQEQSTFGGWYETEYNNLGQVVFSSEKNQDGVTFLYNADGSVKSKRDYDGNITQYEYNKQGLLEVEKNDIGSVFYEYDTIGRPVSVIVGQTNNIKNAEQYTKIEYSRDSRSMAFDYGGVYNEVYILNAWGDVVQKIDGEKNAIGFEYNSLGQVNKVIDAYGNKTSYEYNALGKTSRIIHADNSEELYTYNNIYQLQKVEDAIGIQWQGSFDEAGRLIGERGRNIVEKRYEYDNLDRITQVSIQEEEIEAYKYSDYGTNTVFIDGNNNKYTYSLDSFGRLVKETNRLGVSQHYEYSSSGKLIRKSDFNKGEQFITFDKKNNSISNLYSDNSESILQYNFLGLVTEAKNSTGKLIYTYNKAGLLESQFDENAGEKTYYIYDKAGRRIRYVSGNRDVLYDYGKNGELLRVHDKSQNLSVQYTYDSLMRETSRVFANGVKQQTYYDEVGRIILIKEARANNEVLRAEGYAYNELGQIFLKVNEKALITKFKYDIQGRLVEVFYPYEEEKVLLDKQEASEAGLFFSESAGKVELLNLSNREYREATNLLNKISYGRSNILRSSQATWKEFFTYDKNSNRQTKTTAWGTVAYSYDAENRLTHSGVQGGGTSFTYDANGNLLRKNNGYKAEQFMYNGSNRMIASMSNDNLTKTSTTTKYNYDAFGRRNTVQNEGFATMRTLYDGLSHDIIRESEVFTSGEFATNFAGHRFGYTVTESTSERYLFIDETQANSDFEAMSNYESVGKHFTGAKAPLYAKGEAVGINYTESGHYTTRYFGTDILGSIRSSTQNNAHLESRYEYDAFGAPYKGEFITGLTNGYAGKPYNFETGLYNYGYRDYNPIQARFTTVDPIRDGNNWFSYVVNDPVNFVDMWGLAPRNISEADRKKYIEKLSGYSAYESNTNTLGIPDDYDCADVATYIYSEATSVTSGGNSLSKLSPQYGPIYPSNVENIHSSDFFPEQTDNVTYYKKPDGSSVTSFNNPHVEPGSIMTWEGGKGDSFTGHVATVTDVKRDKKGNVTEITIIHGHLNAPTNTEIIPDQTELNRYAGNFLGFAEIGKNSTTPLKNK